MPTVEAYEKPSWVRWIQPPGTAASGSGCSTRWSVRALNLTHSPENGKVWVPADRVDLRASHASVHTMDSDWRAPGVSDSIESNNSHGAILACGKDLGSCARVWTGNV